MAIARKLGIVMHHMWMEETDFRFGKTARGGVCIAFVSASLVCFAEDAVLGQSVSIPVRFPCQHHESLAETEMPFRAL